MSEQSEIPAAERDFAKRARRFKINLVVWVVGVILLTGLWVLTQWNANGAFERFAHEGNPGDWNPTLWALGVLVWGLIVGIKGLRVHFERTAPGWRLEGVRRLKFHAAAWVLGMVVITPLNVLIEWQDNGNFERLSSNSQPGSWDPWVLYIGGAWALVIGAISVGIYAGRPKLPGRGKHPPRIGAPG